LKDNTSLGKLYGMAGAVALMGGNFKVGVPLLITAGILKATDLEEKVKQSELNRQRAKTARKWLEESQTPHPISPHRPEYRGFTKEELPPDYRKSLEYFEGEIPTVRVLGSDAPLVNPGISGPGLPGGGFNPFGVGFDMGKVGLSTPGQWLYFVFNMKDVTIKSDNPKELVDSLKQQADQELRRKGINP
jgi:hypothetical protein